MVVQDLLELQVLSKRNKIFTLNIPVVGSQIYILCNIYIFYKIRYYTYSMHTIYVM